MPGFAARPDGSEALGGGVRRCKALGSEAWGQEAHARIRPYSPSDPFLPQRSHLSKPSTHPLKGTIAVLRQFYEDRRQLDRDKGVVWIFASASSTNDTEAEIGTSTTMSPFYRASEKAPSLSSTSRPHCSRGHGASFLPNGRVRGRHPNRPPLGPAHRGPQGPSGSAPPTASCRRPWDSAPAFGHSARDPPA